MIGEKSIDGWSTADEIAFLRGLGVHRPYPNQDLEPRPERTVMLAGYVAALPKRSRWGHIDAEAVRAEIERMTVERLAAANLDRA